MKLKRVFDVVVVVAFAPLWLPLFLLVAAAVWAVLGSPIFFCQQRTGLGGRTFRILKFRTMSDICDERGFLLPDGQRLSRFGRWLRSTSLDETPELINVIRGDMSLVGPRPLLPKYLPLYSATQRRRHDVVPGVTGWAQVNGRNSVDWEKRFELDIWYVEHASLWLDLKILARTMGSVALRQDINAVGSPTMHEFVPKESNESDV